MAFDPLSLLAAGLNLAGNIYANEQNSRNIDKQNAFNLKMWNLQNEYNNPLNQVGRLRAAGLNPALAMSNIQTGTAQGLTSSVHQPTINPMQGVADTFNNSLVQSRQSELIEAQTGLIQAQTAGELAKNKYVDDREKAGIANTASQTALNEQAKDFNNKNNELILQENQAKINNLASSTAVNEAVKKQYGYVLDNILPKQAEQLQASISQINASIELMKQQKMTLKASVGLMSAQIGKLVQETNGLSIENSYKKKVILTNLDYTLSQIVQTHANSDYLKGKNEREQKMIVFDMIQSGTSSFKNVAGGIGDILKGVGDIVPG